LIPSLLFRPRLLDAVRGYDRDRFLRDLGAGLTVGVVALPLAMAFAIASGLPPAAGLWTAIIAGLLVALLGGSNVQIGGPAGAFIVIVYGIIERYGVANLLIATACAGVLLFVLGDRDGTTCEPAFVDLVESKLRSFGYTVARNDPYKGVQLIERIGRPAQNRHSLQIEIRRPLYMDEATRQPHAGFERLKACLDDVLAAVAAHVRTRLA
jgi:hypothetical protein